MQSLEPKIKTNEEYNEWSKSGKRPNNIPSSPDRYYKNSGWNGWPDYLGTEVREFLPLDEAKKFMQSLEPKIKTNEEYNAWSKSGNRPNYIPGNPTRYYKNSGCTGWPDYLGTEVREFLSLDEAKKFMQSLEQKITKKEEYQVWSKSGNRPNYIPGNPTRYYKNSGCTGWADFLGTEFLPLDEAKKFMQSLEPKITTQLEYKVWSKSGKRPNYIPGNPDKYYKNSGWNVWADYLGVVNVWNNTAILSFVKSMDINTLTSTELYVLMTENGLLDRVNRLEKNHPLAKMVSAINANEQIDQDALITELENTGSDDLLDDDGIQEDESDDEITATTDLSDIENVADKPKELKTLKQSVIFSSLDGVYKSIGQISDEETVNFFVNSKVGQCWTNLLDNQVDESTIINDITDEVCNSLFSTTARDRFLTQYDGAKKLKLPKGYQYKKNGKKALPNLMQKLIAFRLTQTPRLGNWSGTGAGKTLAAILASRHIKAKLTIIIGLNSTINQHGTHELSGWAKEINEAFPSSNVIIKPSNAAIIEGDLLLSNDIPNYLLLNYEKFQQSNSSALVKELLNLNPDMLIIDEIHSVKATTDQESARRQRIIALSNNIEYVLGMSATPVVNNLYEAKSLLEMIDGKVYDDINTKPSLNNALRIHCHLVNMGVRFIPKYNMQLAFNTPEILISESDAKQLVNTTGILGLESALLDFKLDTIVELLQSGEPSIIYTHYINNNIIKKLQETLDDNNISYATYTGDDKSGLNQFKNKQAQTLIASSTIGTGVDGLQYITDNLIIISLPWTSAAYEQLIGRIYRQGSIFTKINVSIPQVIAHHDNQDWSWDKQRMGRIKWKQTLADAAVDGVIPKKQLMSQSDMLTQSKTALHNWINRLEDGTVFSISRKTLQIPLPDDIARSYKITHGDFTAMNNKFNTSRSDTMHQYINKNPDFWYNYHNEYNSIRQTWPEIPFITIANNILSKKKKLTIGDMGCGQAMIADILKDSIHTVYSFDHFQYNNSVIQSDISNINMPDESLDRIIFSLSLMSTNWIDYITEAHRLLSEDGQIIIADRTSKLEIFKDKILNIGFNQVGNIEFSQDNSFFYLTAMKI